MLSTVFIAVGIALVGTTVLNIGMTLQKNEAAKLPMIHLRNLKSILDLFTHGKWILGTFLTFLGWGAFFLAVTLAPVSLIAPLSTVGVLILVFTAVLILKEQVQFFEWFGVFLTIGGVLLVIIAAARAQEAGSAFNPKILATLVLLFMVFLLLAFLTHKYFFSNKTGVILSIIAGVFTGLGAVFTKAFSETLNQSSIITNPNIYLILIFQAFSFLMLQASFQHERAIIIIPLFNSFATVIPLFCGVFAFKEYVSSLQTIGVMKILIGTSILFKFNDQTTQELLE